MKKLSYITAALALILALSSCGNKAEPKQTSAQQTEAPVSASAQDNANAGNSGKTESTAAPVIPGVLYSLNLKNGEEPMRALINKFKERIERHAEAVEVNEDWGKRKLAYPIDDETEGYYVIYTFESKPDYPAELTRRLNITDGILRSLVTVL
jgi:small subunit ribosomal protein S6